jgi:glucose-6-phosphate 1-dehydrogenase
MGNACAADDSVGSYEDARSELPTGSTLTTTGSNALTGTVVLDKLREKKEQKRQLTCEDMSVCEKESYAVGKLSIVVLGASGDLAKKKTYPALMDLFHHKFLPKHVCIVGYARSAQSTEAFRTALRPWLLKVKDAGVVDAFLECCYYCQGAYGSDVDFAKLDTQLKDLENQSAAQQPSITNRLFYFAIPPDAFLDSATSIKKSALCKGFNRLIVEKPFGHDLASAKKLAADLGAIFAEEFIYRIDHYLGKEIVQNLMMFRFGNRFLEPVLNKDHVSCVRITFKEDFGTEGRGGYFTNYGIIRDVIQNHLMQVLSLVAMEAPATVVGPEAGLHIRDKKVEVLKAIQAINMDEVFIGQYIGDGAGKPGYLEDESIKDRAKAEYVPTYATVVLRINTPRWQGVPFIMKAGKALDERKAEIRIQFKDAPNAEAIFGGQPCARNELVMNMQPNEVIYMKTTMKTPGLQTTPVQTELDLTYKDRFTGAYNPDAYTRLILEALRGNQENFVRSDELEASWKLFDPLLSALEAGSTRKKPLPYKYGSRGPAEADAALGAYGFAYTGLYQWSK